MGERMSEQQIGVEVVYALPQRQEIFSLRLPFKVQRINPLDVTDIRSVVLTSAAREGSQH